MTFWLGKPGALVALPHPGRGISADLTIASQVTETIGGGRAVDRAPTGRRAYELDWTSLTPEQHSLIEEFFVGARGTGPFVLLDPWRRNQLTAQQSSATSVSNDTTGFATIGAGATTASSTALFERGPRALAWSLPASPSGVRLNVLAPNALWPGIPVVAGLNYRWQTRQRLQGLDTSAQIQPRIDWMNAAGSVIFTDAAGTIPTIVDTAFGDCVLAANAPAGAVYALPHVAPIAATVTATTTVHIDRLMFSMSVGSSAGTTWVLGTGVPMVSVVQSPTAYRKPSRRRVGLTLVEVG
ncbi:hypothetical protein ACFFX1_55035 [Dactylosporangium sucinum]|uniref:Uncharacterized protein n=1 Tax=Dactylosporangium sucinum TaxID=1424081 RepID=A0A917U285_9ACTN|nr:hypothetical protein [Dactylosporangium sucinum]GGM53155.1 hypothetical protein GCM10007977_063530 [Dactylosporangium sucinum]